MHGPSIEAQEHGDAVTETADICDIGQRKEDLGVGESEAPRHCHDRCRRRQFRLLLAADAGRVYQISPIVGASNACRVLVQMAEDGC